MGEGREAGRKKKEKGKQGGKKEKGRHSEEIWEGTGAKMQRAEGKHIQRRENKFGKGRKVARGREGGRNIRDSVKINAIFHLIIPYTVVFRVGHVACSLNYEWDCERKE